MYLKCKEIQYKCNIKQDICYLSRKRALQTEMRPDQGCTDHTQKIIPVGISRNVPYGPREKRANFIKVKEKYKGKSASGNIGNIMDSGLSAAQKHVQGKCQKSG